MCRLWPIALGFTISVTEVAGNWWLVAGGLPLDSRVSRISYQPPATRHWLLQ